MTAAVGAALRISVETGVDVSPRQLRAVLADTATCLRQIRADEAWRVVAEDSGHPEAFGAGFDQAVALIEKSATEPAAVAS